MKIERVVLIVSVLINLFQVASREAREWAALSVKPTVESTDVMQTIPYSERTKHDTDTKTGLGAK